MGAWALSYYFAGSIFHHAHELSLSGLRWRFSRGAPGLMYGVVGFGGLPRGKRSLSLVA